MARFPCHHARACQARRRIAVVLSPPQGDADESELTMSARPMPGADARALLAGVARWRRQVRCRGRRQGRAFEPLVAAHGGVSPSSAAARTDHAVLQAKDRSSGSRVTADPYADTPASSPDYAADARRARHTSRLRRFGVPPADPKYCRISTGPRHDRQMADIRMQARRSGRRPVQFRLLAFAGLALPLPTGRKTTLCEGHYLRQLIRLADGSSKVIEVAADEVEGHSRASLARPKRPASPAAASSNGRWGDADRARDGGG